MDNEIKTWLFDILNSILEIESFFIEKSKKFEEYEKDILLKRAIERNIEIIGEAMNRILKKESDIEISNARKIVDIRNRIIHGYDSVSDDVMWSIIIKYLPVLKKEVQAFLTK